MGAAGRAGQGPGPPQPLPFGFGVFPPARLTGRVPGLNRRAACPAFLWNSLGQRTEGGPGLAHRAGPRAYNTQVHALHLWTVLTTQRRSGHRGSETTRRAESAARDSEVSPTGLRAGGALVTLPSQVACPQGPHHRTAHARPPGRPCLGLAVCPQKGVIRVHADQVPGSHWGEGVLQGHRGPRRTERARTTVAPLRPAHLLHGVCTYACTVRVCVYVHLLCTANPGQSAFTKRAGVRGFSSLW